MRPERTALVALLWVGSIGPGSAQQRGPLSLTDVSRGIEVVAARVAPTVVQIRVTAYGPVAGASGGASALLTAQRSTGSGVILSADGYIITNAHVVEGGRRFLVAIPRPAAAGVPGRSAVKPVPQEVAGRLVGVDRETDLAVLKVDLTDLPFATLGDSDSLGPGRLVLAFGSPLGLANSVTMGVVSAVGRQLHPEDPMLYIQTDTPINPGNSGGPLVDGSGLVVGINTLIISQSGGNEGIGFAAPANIVRHVFQQIRAYQRVRRGAIGVYAQTVTPGIAAGLKLPRDWGAVLGDVYPGGPAEQAGLRQGDMVYSVDGKQIENGRQLDVTLYRKPLGQPVTLEVARGPQRLILRVPVVERRDDGQQFSDLVTTEQNLVPQLGVLALDMTPQLAQAIPGLRNPRGVVVAAVAADAVGDFVPGDVLHALNGGPLATLAELRAALAALPGGTTAVLLLERQGQFRFIPVAPE
jgi:serine protease Do